MYDNLRKLRESLGMTQAEIAKTIYLGNSNKPITRTTFANYEAGKTQPTSEFWIAIAEKYQVSVDWLIGFSDDPHRVKFAGPSELEKKYRALDEHGKKVVDFILEAETERVAEAKTEIIDFGTIRHYLSSPAAGHGGLAGQEFEEIPRTKDTPHDADYCLTVSGDSMEPYIYDGQMVFVKRDAQMQLYDVGVWCYQGGTYVKQFYEDETSVQLLSANPDRENANLKLSREFADDLEFQGKVLGLRKLPKPVYNGSL